MKLKRRFLRMFFSPRWNCFFGEHYAGEYGHDALGHARKLCMRCEWRSGERRPPSQAPRHRDVAPARHFQFVNIARKELPNGLTDTDIDEILDALDASPRLDTDAYIALHRKIDSLRR